MALENSNVQREFSTKERSKAEFWAWLTDGFIFSKETAKGATERTLTVISREKMKDAIREALKMRNPERAQELLEIASRDPEDLREDMVRKSIRVSPGEYAALLYLKIREHTSFADAMMKVLFEPCKKKAEEIKGSDLAMKPIASSKLQHLMEVINDWETEKPDVRASIVQTGHWSKRPGPSSVLIHRETPNENDIPGIDSENGKSFALIRPFFAKTLMEKPNLQETKNAFSRLLLADILNNVTLNNSDKHAIDLYNEFKEEWKQKVETEFFEHLSFEALVDNSSKNAEFFFKLYFECTVMINSKRELDLFVKYGEKEVIDFVNSICCGGWPRDKDGRYTGITKSDEYEQVESCPYGEDDDDFKIFVGASFDFTCCKITPLTQGNSNVSSDEISHPYLDSLTKQFEPLMQEIAEKVGNTFAVKKYEERKNNQEPYSFTAANDLLSKALDAAQSPEDYKKINNLLTIIHMQQDYDSIVDFGRLTAISTLKHNSVVSLYINSDLWRLVPLVLEERNWTYLVQYYLNLK
jgi:hypothetical protein